MVAGSECDGRRDVDYKRERPPQKAGDLFKEEADAKSFGVDLGDEDVKK